MNEYASMICGDITYSGFFINGALNGFVVVTKFYIDIDGRSHLHHSEELMFKANIRRGVVKYVDNYGKITYKDETDTYSILYAGDFITYTIMQRASGYFKNHIKEEIIFGMGNYVGYKYEDKYLQCGKNLHVMKYIRKIFTTGLVSIAYSHKSMITNEYNINGIMTIKYNDY